MISSRAEQVKLSHATTYANTTPQLRYRTGSTHWKRLHVSQLRATLVSAA